MDAAERWWLGLCAFAIGLLVQVPYMVWVLIGMQVVDMVSGIAVAYNRGRLCSTVARKGATKKGLMLLLVSAVYALDHCVGGKMPLAPGVASYYCYVEGLSILENYGKLGIPIPKSIKRGLEALKGDEENGDKPDA